MKFIFTQVNMYFIIENALDKRLREYYKESLLIDIMGKYAPEFKEKITPELIYLAESFRVEGYWSIKHKEAAIQNKNLSYLDNIEKLLNDYKIKPIKRTLVKVFI